jgi:hypothetical protein
MKKLFVGLFCRGFDDFRDRHPPNRSCQNPTSRRQTSQIPVPFFADFLGLFTRLAQLKQKLQTDSRDE